MIQQRPACWALKLTCRGWPRAGRKMLVLSTAGVVGVPVFVGVSLRVKVGETVNVGEALKLGVGER